MYVYLERQKLAKETKMPKKFIYSYNKEGQMQQKNGNKKTCIFFFFLRYLLIEINFTWLLSTSDTIPAFSPRVIPWLEWAASQSGCPWCYRPIFLLYEKSKRKLTINTHSSLSVSALRAKLRANWGREQTYHWVGGSFADIIYKLTQFFSRGQRVADEAQQRIETRHFSSEF